jgi:hypothetical protein
MNKSYSGVCVSVCVSQDVLRFNITTEPVTAMAGSLWGQEGGGAAGGKPENF